MTTRFLRCWLLAILLAVPSPAVCGDDRQTQALITALRTLEPLEARSLELSSNGDDVVALFGVPGDAQVRRINETANAILAAALHASENISAALRAIPEETLAQPHAETLSQAISRAEDALAMLIPLRAARATLVKASLMEDPGDRANLAKGARAALLAVESSVPWAEAERGILLALASAELGEGETAIEHLLDARAALRADPRLADEGLRLTLQIATGSVLATLAEAGPDEAHRALERIGERQPFAPDPEATVPRVDPLARLLLADLNTRIELSRLQAAGGMSNASPAFRQRVLDSIARGYVATLEEPALREHRESLRVLAYRRLARLVPESIDIDDLPIFAALARVARYEDQLRTTTDASEADALARRVVDLLRVLAARDDAAARSIRADVLYDLAAAEQRIGQAGSAAERLLAFVRIRPDDERAARAIPRAMTLAEQAGDRRLALEAGWFAHRAPFEVPERDAIRLRLISLLVDGNAYRDPEDPSRFDLRRFFAALLVEADRIAEAIDRAGLHGLALRETLVSGDAWSLALAERFPDQIAELELSPVALASQAERRATDLLTFVPPANARRLSAVDRARALAHRARAWLLLNRPLDAVTDADLALDALHGAERNTGVRDPLVYEDVLALLARAAAESRQHERARVALERALDRPPGERGNTDRLLSIIAALHHQTKALIEQADRDFPADPTGELSPGARDLLTWLPERTAFLIEAATQLEPDEQVWHDALRFQHAHACVLAGHHERAIVALDALHAGTRPSVPSLLLLGESHLLSGDDAKAFAAFRSVVAALDATAEHDPALWRAWARMVEILERQAELGESGQRASSTQRQIRRLRLRDGYATCEPCRLKVEAAAQRLGIDAPATGQ